MFECNHTILYSGTLLSLEFVSKMAIDSALEIWFSQLDKATAPTLIATDYLTIIPKARALDVRWQIANEARRAELAIIIS